MRSTKYETNPNIECSKFKTKVSGKRHFGYFDISSAFPPKEKTETNSSIECSKSKECLSRSTRLGHLNFGIVSSFGFRISSFLAY